MGLYDYTIYSIIKRNARIYGNRTAWISGDQRITHGEFREKVDRLAGGLMGIGLGKGDRIGVLAQNSLEFIYLFGAAAKIGAIMLPINWRLKTEEVEYIISDGSPKVIFAGLEYLDMLKKMCSNFDFVKHYYVMGQAEGDFASFYNLMDQHRTDCPELPVHSDDAYVIIHTAAVGGRPRGATLTHRSLIVANMQAMYYLSLTKDDCNLGMLPLFHLAGLGFSLNLMHAGGVNIILPKFDPDLALKHIEEDKVTLFGEFPPMLTTLLDKAQDNKCDLSSLRVVTGLDHPETVKRFEEMTNATFWAMYGQSETSGFVSFAPFAERPGSAGMPSLTTEMEIVDDYGNVVDTGKPGEIVVRGPLVFKGYWNLDAENEYTFRDGWHHTGDMGRFDEDGYLWYVGRKSEKELIKPGGENVYPVEVEKVIMKHPVVEEVSVIGVPDQQWGEAIKAVCVLKKGESLNETDMIEFVATRIARYKKPKFVVFASRLPKTEDGSIDRDKVKAEYGKS